MNVQIFCRPAAWQGALTGLLLGMSLWLPVAAQAIDMGTELGLAEAEDLALQLDPVINALGAQARSFEEQSIAANTLPDPQLKLGAMNLPVDTFALDQEPMTQLQIGVRQMFPRGDTLEIRARRAGNMSNVVKARAENRRRMVRRSVREAWLEVYYWHNAAEIVRKTRSLFQQLLDITEGQYAAGRGKQQDYIQAQLEYGLLEDREERIRNREAGMRAQLARWIGSDNAARVLAMSLPAVPPARSARLEDVLVSHPLVEAAQGQVAVSNDGVDLARQAYRPGWMLDITYASRDGVNPNGVERPDFVSAMVVLDIPLFTGNRQDRMLVAREHERSAAEFQLEDQRLVLKRMFERLDADRVSLDERIQYYQRVLIPRSHENASAALSAYQSDEGDFLTLVRARIVEFETELKALRLKIDRAKVQAGLNYILGEEQ
ncbi:MAG TPA: TolC family protein [Gammaproteobacteria bacterium]|nr:TolC family protein [Gammaproteobacteria bacterium]